MEAARRYTNPRNYDVKIRTYYIASSLAMAAVLAVVGAISVIALRIHDDLVRMETHRFHSYLLAMELFQSSEDMSRMARKYAATGNADFERYYYQILDMRNGVIPHPKEFNAAYWMLSGEGLGPAVEMAPPESLQDRMRREGITEEEISLLREAQAHSDHLGLKEKKAFAAVKGLFDDGRGGFTKKGAPDQALAMSLLFSREYSVEKAAIMAPIQEFMTRLDGRTEAELRSCESRMQGNLIMSLGMILLAAVVVGASIFYSFRRILRPIELLEGRVKQIDSGNYAARVGVHPRVGAEIATLCASFNSMAESLQKDIQRRQDAAAILEKNEENALRLLHSAGEALYGISLDGDCTFANEACARILGYESPDALIGKNMHALIHHSYPDGRPMPVEECQIYRAFRHNEEMHLDNETLWKEDGEAFMAEIWSHPLFSDGKVYGAVVTFNDVTEHRRAEEALSRDRQRLADLLSGSNIGTWESNIENGKVVLSARMAEIMGYSLRELEPATMELRKKFLHPDDYRASTELIEKHLRGESDSYECEVRLRRKDDTWIWVLEKGQVARRGDDGKPLTLSGTLEDITERKEYTERIIHMATHDALTDLPNLRLAKDRLSMAIRRSKRSGHALAAMFVDLDGFKMVNDTYGHDAGDAVLREVGERLRAGVRDVDTVARIGGDEFLLLVTELTAPENAAEIGKKLVESIALPIVLPRCQAHVGVSIGIAFFPNCAGDVESLIQAADEAMYKVKSAGKNNFAFAPCVSHSPEE